MTEKLKQINIEELENLMFTVLQNTGLKDEDCQWVTEIFMRATYRGVGHHDVYSLPGRIKGLLKNDLNNEPQIDMIAKFKGLEVYDGDNGLGEQNCYFITKRSQELADENGVSLVSIKNSNHFLAAAPYVELSAEEGYFSVIFSSVGNVMGVGDSPRIIGNGPLGYSIKGEQENVLFDICLAYSSYGKLHARAKAGEKVPEYWGKDKDGEYTANPSEIIDGGIPLPIGEHKGFGLSMMIEFITSVLAGGEIGFEKEKTYGRYTHTIITLKPEKINENYKDNVDKLINDMKEMYPDLHIPGDSSYRHKQKVQNRGYFELKESIIAELNSFS
ncbi:MAG: Ldh family oxidoreductase [Bacillota bacterium]